MSPLASELVLVDVQALQDLGRYAARARALDADGAVRLQAVGRVLASWVGVLPGSGLLGVGTTVGLRTSELAEPAELDVLVPLAAVSDRVAHSGDRPVLPVPPMTVKAAWAALSPPRSGWLPVGVVSAEALQHSASEGIAEVADGTPEGAGAHAVAALREQVWRRPMAGTTPEAPVPAALAFAAYALGFLSPGTQATVATSGRWTRLTTPAGHALTRS